MLGTVEMVRVRNETTIVRVLTITGKPAEDGFDVFKFDLKQLKLSA